MAVMIPSIIYKGCASPGEQEIFRRLKNDPGTAGWTVLHSLDIANHLKQVSGEVDFVVLIPGKGVLFLEVKACSSLDRTEQGLWYYGKNSKPDSRGPFKQASSAMHSLRKQILDVNPKLNSMVFWSGVIFPYIEFKTKSVEWHEWEVIDRTKFSSQPLASSLEFILDKARKYLLEEKKFEWLNSYKDSPTAEQCDEITKVLRPNFEFIESSQSLRLDKELKFYTQEQFSALDAMEENPRVAFTGPAGTGKTLLAIESARRSSSEKRRVLLLCFNRLLGKSIDKQSTGFGSTVVARTLHRHMLDVAGIEIKQNEKNPAFWTSELPQRAIEKLLEEPADEFVFDELIIDEAQDILRNDYLDFLDLSLKGGLSSGCWRLFGDFEKQAIYNSAPLSLPDVLESRAKNTPVYSLRINCRNTPRIAETARLLGNLEPNYKRILRPDNGIESQINFYSSIAGQEQLLLENLNNLKSLGYSPEDIVILSTKSDSLSVASKVSSTPWNNSPQQFLFESKNRVRFSSVHSFKGLEAPVIIVTDIESVSDPASVALFYIAITRSVERLVLLVKENIKEDIIKLLS